MAYQYDDDTIEAKRVFKKIVFWIIAFVIMSSIGTFLCTRAVKTVDTGILRYEEFQELQNTCIKLNTDLCNMKDLPETDKMFEQFSKAQRVLQIKTQLNRWVEDYNAKSKMFNRSLWRSKTLPEKLSVSDFNCY